MATSPDGVPAKPGPAAQRSIARHSEPIEVGLESTHDAVAAPRERADASRNRTAALAAARQLFDERGVQAVTMDDIAAAAGVGKGTLYRRFGDKSGLAMALLDSTEAQLQQRMLSGPPPLGPGTDATSRLVAFVQAYLDLVVDQLDLILMSQTATVGARHRSGVHAFWRAHCRILLTEAKTPAPEVRAEVLLAALAGEQISYWVRTQGLPASEVRRNLTAVAEALAGAEPQTIG